MNHTLENYGRGERLLLLQCTVIDNRNELSDLAYIRPNRYYDSLSDIEVTILAIIVANYPNDVHESMRSLQIKYNNKKIPIGIYDILEQLIRKNFVVHSEGKYFLHDAHIDHSLETLVLSNKSLNEDTDHNSSPSYQ